MDYLDAVREDRIMPVVVIEDAEQALPLAGVLQEAGLHNLEFTLRTPAGLEALRRVAEGSEMCVGAGTVLSIEQAQAAREAGARFLVAPGSNPEVIQYCQDHGIPILPGACTPTEIELARARGLKTLKFFPAEPAGGAKFLKAVSAPFPDMQFVPTGAINDTNIESYLALPCVVGCGTGWIVEKSLVANRDWDEVGRRCRVLLEMAKACGASPC